MNPQVFGTEHSVYVEVSIIELVRKKRQSES